MNRILQILREPFPLEEDKRAQMVSNILISCLVILILVIFKPFGLAYVKFQMAKQVPVYLGYGLITFLMCLMSDLLIKPAFPIFFDEQKWTVGKNIMWVVFIIMLVAVGNLFLSNALGFTGVSGTSLLRFQFYTISVAIFPVTIVTLIARIRLLRKNLRQVREINDSLSTPVPVPEDHSVLIFTSENGKEQIKIHVNQFLFAESADNYSDIVYVENSIVKRELIRSTLNRIEEMNTAPFVVRVHRSYLVNLAKVRAVTGNSQGYRLVFNDVEESLPVSRRLSERIKELLKKIHSGSRLNQAG